MDYTISINNFFFYNLFIIIIIPILLLYNGKFYFNETNDEPFKKKATNTLKGFAIILVFLGHFTQRLEQYNFLFHILKNAGLYGVIIFLFISGYGSYTQYSKSSNYLSKKYFYKILNLLLTYFVCNIFVSLLEMLFFKQDYSIVKFITSTMTLSFCNGRNIWFLVMIIYNYLSFFLTFKILKKEWLIYISFIPYVLIFSLLGFGSWWYNSAISFPIGIYLAKNEKKIINKMKKGIYLKLFTSIFIFAVIVFLYQFYQILFLQFLIPIVLIASVVLICILFDFNSSFFQSINKFSFEIYLIQPFFMDLIFKYVPLKDSITMIITLVLTILFSIIINFLINKFRGVIK